MTDDTTVHTQRATTDAHTTTTTDNDAETIDEGSTAVGTQSAATVVADDCDGDYDTATTRDWLMTTRRLTTTDNDD